MSGGMSYNRTFKSFFKIKNKLKLHEQSHYCRKQSRSSDRYIFKGRHLSVKFCMRPCNYVMYHRPMFIEHPCYLYPSKIAN